MSDNITRNEIQTLLLDLNQLKQEAVAMAASLRELVAATQELHSFLNNLVEEAKKEDQKRL